MRLASRAAGQDWGHWQSFMAESVWGVHERGQVSAAPACAAPGLAPALSAPHVPCARSDLTVQGPAPPYGPGPGLCNPVGSSSQSRCMRRGEGWGHGNSRGVQPRGPAALISETVGATLGQGAGRGLGLSWSLCQACPGGEKLECPKPSRTGDRSLELVNPTPACLGPLERALQGRGLGTGAVAGYTHRPPPLLRPPAPHGPQPGLLDAGGPAWHGRRGLASPGCGGELGPGQLPRSLA